jgi:AraC-like DNA-binding protein
MKPYPQNLLRYLPVSQRDRQWGLYVNDAGWQAVGPGEEYPPGGHPRSYAFTWERGRSLPEFQLVYIVQGEGEFESQPSGARRVIAGTMLLLFPGVWHRYRPLASTGWEEFWIGYNGEYAERLLENQFLRVNEAVVYTGGSEIVHQLYVTVLDRLQHQPPGFEQIIAANTLEIIAATLGAQRMQASGSRIYRLVREAKTLLETVSATLPRMEEVAAQLGLSPTHFHRVFKQHTGLTPYQYHVQVRLARAKGLLRTTDMPIKDVAFELGFESVFHFTTSFHARTGVTPSHWRSGRNSKDEPPQSKSPASRAGGKPKKRAEQFR